MHVVLDTNVFLSALLGGRSTRPILKAFTEARFQLVISETLLKELSFVLSRTEWKQLVDSKSAYELLAILQETAAIVKPRHHSLVCRDPEDNAVLDCAIAGHAAIIVTGDKDLLVLHPFQGIQIIRPSEFLRSLTS